LASQFPTGNPARNALASNFEEINATNSVLRHGKLLASMNFHLYYTVYSRCKFIGRWYISSRVVHFGDQG